MKRVVTVLIFILSVMLCGCSQALNILAGDSISLLKDWSFQYNEETDQYTLFFGLLNDNNKYVSSDVNADIKIVNDNGIEVYKKTVSVSQNDFHYFTHTFDFKEEKEKMYLAAVYIPAADIAVGKSFDGKLYFKVYKTGVVSFDEISFDVSNLPGEDIQLKLDPAFAEAVNTSYIGTDSVIRITGVSCGMQKKYSPSLKITVSGEKTFGEGGTFNNTIGYKVYNSGGVLTASGNIYLDDLLVQGDKFVDDSVVLYDITPGEVYTIKFTGRNS